MKTITIIVYADPGHAWGKVKRKLLIDLGIADKISRYSYQNNDNVFLEEDCDLSLLQGTLLRAGTIINYVEKHTNKRSRIRSYDCFEHGFN